MRKLLVVSPLLLVLGAGCGATRRDFAYCDQKYHDCLKGSTCDFTKGLCVPETDAGAPDAMVGEDAPKVDVAPVMDIGSDSKDAPVVVDVNVIDTSIVDINQAVDLPSPDLRVPDAAGTCSVDSDCTGVAASYCVNNRCVACKTSSQCNNDAGVPFCSAQNTCVSCASASSVGSVDGGIDGGVSAVCSGAIPVCNSATGSCVQCVKNADCPTAAKAFCVQNQCTGCDTPGASSGGIDGGTGANACSGTSKPVCVPNANGGPKVGQCVVCNPDNGNRDCSGNTPICDEATYTCKPCTSDSQCTTGPGICLFHSGGRCATEAETIYVNNVGGGNCDTPTTPFCQLQTAVNAVKADKRVILVKGTSALLPFSADFGAGTPQVSIIGQNDPIILVGAASAGIELITGNLYLRGLTVQGTGNASANGFGIQVDSTASLIALDRCVVNGNRGGMLINDGPGFDIVNSIFAQNKAGSVGAALFGGVYLGNPSSTSAIHRFWFNTVADNEQLGVTCSVKGQNLDACLLADTSGEVVNCTLTKWTKSSTISPTGVAGTGFTTDNSPPLFSAAKPYHLSATSPCKNFITDSTVALPLDDVDGETRPNGAAADCGADEYWP